MGGWNQERSSHELEVQRIKNQILTSLEYLNSSQNINGIANNDTSLIAARETKINQVNQNLSTLKEKQSVLSQKLKTLLDEQMVFVQNASNLRVQIRQEQEELAKSQNLNKIRKEQAESLKIKYSGNLHSSWLGLWVPLSDEFRAGLIVASLALFFSIILLIVFLWYNGFILTGTGQFMVGGVGHKKTRILYHTH